MRKKFSKIGGGCLVVFLILAAIGAWYGRRMMYGVQDRGGFREPVPQEASTFPEITKGEADWPCWRGPKHDGSSPQTGLITDWGDGLTLQWRVGFLCKGRFTSTWGAPVVQGNRLIVPGRTDTHDQIFCLDAASGELIWESRYESEAKRGYGRGPRASACIANERVYTFSRSGQLGCWNLLDGKKQWLTSVKDDGGAEPGWGYASSPFVHAGTVYVQAGGSARAAAYDAKTGQLVWNSGAGPAGYATATLLPDESALLFFHGTRLAAHDPDTGKEFWNLPWKTAHDVNASTPAVAGNIVFITSGYGTGCQAIEVDGKSAKPIWTSDVIASQHSDPVIIDGHIYGYSGQSNQNRGSLKCVELSTGEEKWSSGEAGWGTLLLADGHLVCLDIKGNLHLVKPDPSKFIKVAEMKQALPDNKNPAWTMPVIANGLLYLRYEQRLLCYKIAE